MALDRKKVQTKPKKKSPAAKKAAKPAIRRAGSSRPAAKTRPKGKGTARAGKPAVKGASRAAQSKSAAKKGIAENKPAPKKTSVAAKAVKPAGKKTTAGRKAVPVKTAVRKTGKVLPAATKKKPVVRVQTVAGKPAKKAAVSGKLPAPAKKAAAAPADNERIRDLKNMLITRREGILKEAKGEIAKYMSGDNRQLVDTAIDEGDWAVVDISEDLSLRRLDSHRKLLQDIDECLRKIKEGTYGICEECGEEISQKRLNVIPTATLCIDCKENRERLEALEHVTEI